jgi:hypothetical protein
MTNTQTTFARVTLEYDKAPECAPLEAITDSIFENDRNPVVRTAEASLAVLTVKRLLRGAR